MTKLPILYSFRRCPYAMRARLALLSGRQATELREIVLRNKPSEMLKASPKGTVPVLLRNDGSVLEESLDIALWVLGNNDPDQLLIPETGNKADMLSLIAESDGPFKHHLDRYKYAPRGKAMDEAARQTIEFHREAAIEFLITLEERLTTQPFLFGNKQCLADIAIAPFVRQFANTDTAWFATLDLPNLQGWLIEFTSSERFVACMYKFEPWQSGTIGVTFPAD